MTSGGSGLAWERELRLMARYIAITTATGRKALPKRVSELSPFPNPKSILHRRSKGCIIENTPAIGFSRYG